MTVRRNTGAHHRSLATLRRLAEHVPHLDVQHGKLVMTEELFEVPADEHGIPDREAFARKIVGEIATVASMEDFTDLHHICWPYTNYQSVNNNGSSLSASFRENPANQLIVHRLTHDVLHLCTQPITPPDEMVMAQFQMESSGMSILRAILTARSDIERRFGYTDAAKAAHRYNLYLDKLATMPEPQIGHMPPISKLAELSGDEAMALLHRRIGVLHVGKEYLVE